MEAFVARMNASRSMSTPGSSSLITRLSPRVATSAAGAKPGASAAFGSLLRESVIDCMLLLAASSFGRRHKRGSRRTERLPITHGEAAACAGYRPKTRLRVRE